MPKGVEHTSLTISDASDSAGVESLMPKGVEHEEDAWEILEIVLKC